MLSRLDTKDFHQFIQESHVKAALKADKGSHAKLLYWSVENLSQKGNHYGMLVTSVRVSYSAGEKAAETTYVVKMLPDTLPDIGKSLFNALFRKEMGFYEHIAPVLNKVLVANGLRALRFPVWYYNSLCNGRGLIFLENLCVRRFQLVDHMKGMELKHSTLSFEELGRLHAASILLNEKMSLKQLTDKYEFLNYDFHRYPGPSEENFKKIYRGSLEAAAEFLHQQGGHAEARKWLHRNKVAPAELMERNLTSEDQFAVICHGDFWTHNMLFRCNDEDEPVELAMIDFQFSRFASVATDLNYLMFMSIRPEMRRANETLFLTCYYSSLSSVLKSVGKSVPFTFEQLLQEYKRRHEWVILFLLLPMTPIIEPPFDVATDDSVEGDPEVLNKYIKHKLAFTETLPIYKSKLLAFFEDMGERGLFP
ncbi:uncharacterized protein [Palaemon carinicauda]|uniref:uncharacterized protein n=1 Tax=Palaemon carinicauda TaxID=392227 RepID=UPI0035B6396F